MKTFLKIPGLIALLLIMNTSVAAYTDYHGTMNDFMGVNVHQQLWQYHYLGTNTGFDMHIPFRWVRNYHPWDWFEPTNNTYLWNFTGEGQWKWFDEYYKRLNQDSVNILICVQGAPSWVTGGSIHPWDNGNGNTEDNYREKAEYLAQLAARYGSSGGLPADKLETSDKIQGLDYCRYFEDFNEENNWWDTAYWPPSQYGKFLNAAHDGRNVAIGTGLPIAGIKQGDAKAFHVLGGLANNGIDKTSKCNGSYLDSSVLVCGRQANQVMDVINIHLYWNNTDSIPWPWTGAAGVCPENGLLERGTNDIAQIKDWRDTHAPGMEIWLTEFGWDTYTGGGNNHSYQYAPELQQANYIIRSFALLKYLGLGKAFVYFDQDPNSASTVQYSSSGLVKDNSNGFSRKISYYFMSTMRAMIGDYSFTSADKHASGSPQLFVYRFSRSAQDVVLMVWCRQGNQQFDNGATIQNYTLAQTGLESCTLITPQPAKLYGDSAILSVFAPGTASSQVIIPLVSETPRFLKMKLSDTGTSVKDLSQRRLSHPIHLRIVDNSATFAGVDAGSTITVFRMDGTVVWRNSFQTGNYKSFAGSAGVYTYFINNYVTKKQVSGSFVLPN
jgi:hypothetical protein